MPTDNVVYPARTRRGPDQLIGASSRHLLIYTAAIRTTASTLPTNRPTSNPATNMATSSC